VVVTPARNTLVYVTERNGYSYRAYIDTKTDMADIIWVKRHDVGTRHLLEQIDGASSVIRRTTKKEVVT
jgi:hypothetical protein